MNRNDIVSNGKITGTVTYLDFAENTIKIDYILTGYTKLDEKKVEYEGQIFSPVTAKELWHVVAPFVAKQYSGGIVLVTEYNGVLHFWQGGGNYTTNPEVAKEYQDADIAQNLCQKMRRRNFKFCILDDLVKLHDGRVTFANDL